MHVVFGPGDGQPRQNTDSSLHEYHVAMAFWVGHAALVTEHGNEFTRRVKNVSEFLLYPPGVLAAAAVIVIAAADPIHRAGVDRVAPLIEQRTIVASIHRDLAMAVEL